MSARTATTVTIVTAVESTEQLPRSSSERYVSSAELKELSSEEIAGLFEIERRGASPSPKVVEGESLEIYISREGLQKLSSVELKDLLK